MKFDIEDASMGDGSYSMCCQTLFDNKELAEAKAEEIDFALKLTTIIKDQIKADNDFMYEEDPKTLMGTYSTMVRRGILETLWSKANLE